MLPRAFKQIVMKFILFSCLILFVQCSNTEEFDPPFDISIIQMTLDQPKEYVYPSLIDEGYCCQYHLDYFTGGYELIFKIKVEKVLDEEISLFTNYYNDLCQDYTSFVSLKGDSIQYLCIDEYKDLLGLNNWVYHLDLKEGVHLMRMRFKFSYCEINNGYLSIRFPFRFEKTNELINKKYPYIYEWETKGLYFSVKNGIVAEKPHYDFPLELRIRISEFYEKYEDTNKVKTKYNVM